MPYPEQLPEYLRAILGSAVAREVDLPEGVLVTVTRVELRDRHHDATVWVSVLPKTRAAEIFALLRQHLYVLQGVVNTTLSSRPAPRLVLVLDPGPLLAESDNSHQNARHG